jgi:TPR repeat protein
MSSSSISPSIQYTPPSPDALRPSSRSQTPSPIPLRRVAHSKNLEIVSKKTDNLGREKISECDRSLSTEEMSVQKAKEANWINEAKQIDPRLNENENDPQLQYEIGVRFLDGNENVSKCRHRAFFWLKKAAEGGHMDAQYLVGKFYMYGLVVRRDLILAEHFLEKSAKQKSDQTRKHQEEKLLKEKKEETRKRFKEKLTKQKSNEALELLKDLQEIKKGNSKQFSIHGLPFKIYV